MNKLGDVIRGDTISKRSKDLFVWTACPDCGRERWVRRSKTELQTYTGWCQTCSARRNNKNRAYLTGDGSLAWKGGRTKILGYIEVLLQPEDFFYPMANHRGYVREHRLVMAKHLNRCLLPWEVVHHKGVKYALGSAENKQDNRMENLELLGSNGKHNKEIERLIKQARDEGFKAGIEEAQRRLHSEEVKKITEEALSEQRLVGRREVVDWLINDSYDTTIHFGDDWEVKLKDWGINEIRG